MTTLEAHSYRPTVPADPNLGLVGPTYRWGVVGEATSETVFFKIDPAWFADAAWQAGEAEADRDIASNSMTSYASGKDFLSSL
jgi:hypothetical protein